jgi:hypothetical protein
LETVPSKRRSTPCEEVITGELETAFKEVGARSPVRYRFVCKGRLSHHLMFVSKHPLGVDIMKAVMNAESSRRDNGVGSFGFNETDAAGQGILFPDRPIEELAAELSEKFGGQIFKSFADLYDRSDHPRFGQAEHRKALQILEKRGLLAVVSYSAKRTYRNGELTVPVECDSDVQIEIWVRNLRSNGPRQPGIR